MKRSNQSDTAGKAADWLEKVMKHIIVFIVAVVFVAACAAAPIPTSPSAASPPSPTATVAVPTSSPPTVAPTAVPPTPTSPPTAVAESTRPTNGGNADADESQPTISETSIRVIIGDTVLTGRLWGQCHGPRPNRPTPTDTDLQRLWPTRKLAPLPRKLSTEGLPPGNNAFPGDIGYYSPAGVLVFYYRDVDYFNGIVRIGLFDGNMEAIMSQTGDFTTRIELAP